MSLKEERIEAPLVQAASSSDDTAFHVAKAMCALTKTHFREVCKVGSIKKIDIYPMNGHGFRIEMLGTFTQDSRTKFLTCFTGDLKKQYKPLLKELGWKEDFRIRTSKHPKVAVFTHITYLVEKSNR